MHYLKFFTLFFMGSLLSTTFVYAQDLEASTSNPPVNLEAVFGHEAMTYQLMINKKLKSIPSLGFFSITSLNASWEKGEFDGVMTQGLLTYRVLKGLDVVAGFHYADVTGARPSTGVIYSYAKSNFLIVANPRIDLAKNAISETMVFVEYKPRLNADWTLYSRLQGLYGFSTDSGDHARSYIQARLGVTSGEFTFGLASNFDWYGAFKGYQGNIGGFIAVPLF